MRYLSLLRGLGLGAAIVGCGAVDGSNDESGSVAQAWGNSGGGSGGSSSSGSGSWGSGSDWNHGSGSSSGTFTMPLPIPPVLAPSSQDATTDYYSIRASLARTGLANTADVPVPPMVRLYDVAGASHGRATTSTCELAPGSVDPK